MNKLSPVTFKSLYIMKPENNNYISYQKTVDDFSDEKEVKTYQKRINTGYGYVTHFVANDNKDIDMETYFANHNINYNKIPTQKLLSEDSIKSRMFIKVQNGMFQKNLATSFKIKTDTIEKLLSDSFQYIKSYDELDFEEKLEYQKAKDIIKSGFPIRTPEIYLRKDKKGIELIFENGRYTYAVLRDLGMKEIPFAMGIKSYNIASLEGIIEE